MVRLEINKTVKFNLYLWRQSNKKEVKYVLCQMVRKLWEKVGKQKAEGWVRQSWAKRDEY